MNQEDQDKLNQIESDAHRGVFSERDVCALIQCYREKCAELAAVPMADIQRMTGCEAHTEGTEWAKIRVQQWLRENGRHGFWPPEDFRK